MRLRPYLVFLLVILAVCGLAGGFSAFMRFTEGREEIVGFWSGIVYALVVAAFIGLSLAVAQFAALNAIFTLRPEIDFESLKIPILVVEALLGIGFVIILSYLLPLRFHEL